MKIFVAQISPKVGDLSGNVRKIKDAYKRALLSGADVCLLPELALSGYFAGDLFLKPSFIAEIQKIGLTLSRESGKTVLLLTMPILEDGKLYNGFLACQNGEIIGRSYKKMLPNSHIFDEKRYFYPGSSNVILVNGRKVGVPICEDIWHAEVCLDLKQQGAEIFLVPNASPFEKGKLSLRAQMATARFEETKLPIIYCNQATAHDGIVFDGRSFTYDGAVNLICDAFKEDSFLVSFDDNGKIIGLPKISNLSEEEEIYQAMLLGLGDYVRDNGFTSVVLGLSGGIDSALVAAICVDALGAANVKAFMLPSIFTSENSLRDAKKIADLLSIELINIPIDELLGAFSASLALPEDILAHQNLQSRIRGVILMAESNRSGSLLITTGNKSEYATGYATLYGDMNGAFNPIKDLYKTEIFKIAKYRNNISYVIPESVITKTPSAELAKDQKDTDNLPPYDILDAILKQYIEHDKSSVEIAKEFGKELVDKVVSMVNIAEFKRQQAASGVKISKRNFEKDRRYPITNKYKG